jgi:hypothetical protein
VVERMSRFLNWMHTYWYWSTPATLFAALCCSPASPPKLMKNLRARQRNRALEGLRNAAWDLAYVGLWSKNALSQGVENRCWMLCSADKTLRDLANHSLTKEGPGADEGIRRHFCDVLGQRSGPEVFARYRTLVDQFADPIRAINQRDDAELIEYGDRMVVELEAAMLQPISP